jgi:NAD(P)-dependent dehydrogenase (short-subunit alcohol dehydrogenase family)
MNSKQEGRVVLITGASSGIGQACAGHLHRCGYRVYGTSRRTAGDGEIAAISFNMIKMDVDDEQSVRAGVEQVLNREGRLDAVVNNAGFGIAGAIEDTSTQEAKAQFETNFFGVLRVCRAVLPIMRAQQAGYIVNVGSMAGQVGVPCQGLYSASKSAVAGLTEALRLEVRPFGIHVVLIEPGDFVTDFPARRQRVDHSRSGNVYRERCEVALSIMENDERNGQAPIQVARLLEKVLRDPSPRLSYTVGPLSQRVAVALKKIVPSWFFEWGLAKYYKLDQVSRKGD